jgi:hypothetical protein
MKNEQSIIGRHAFHKLLVEAISQATQDEKTLIREALLHNLDRETRKLGSALNGRS